MEKFTTPAAVEQIARRTEPALRNLQITQSYFELSTMIAQRLGGGANWCTFATWASKQAGQTIRKEDFSEKLKLEIRQSSGLGHLKNWLLNKFTHLAQDGLTNQLAELLGIEASVNRSSNAVARGNQKVFAEIGREFARFAATCLKDETFDAQNLTRFCQALRPGGPPEGQQYLIQAFSHYYQAMFENDADAKAEWMLLANLEIGFHEQTRLQPEIKEALDAALNVDPHVFQKRLLESLVPEANLVEKVGTAFTRLTGRPTPLDRLIQQTLESVKGEIRRFLTRHLMVLDFPGDLTLRLARDLSAGFPPHLRQLANPELKAFLAKIDPTPDSPVLSGTEDWSNLPDRLHFIADLFRCYHEASELFQPPFDEQQVRLLQEAV